MRIYISTWGNPRQWRYAEYIYSVKTTASSSLKSFSTLDLVFSSQELKPDLALIFTLDTLVLDPDVRDARIVPNTSYESIVSHVRQRIERYLCIKEKENVVVEVLPGIMGGRGGLEFRGNLDDTKLLALHHAYFHSLRRVLQRGESVIDASLDTSHGINYFITLISGVVHEALAALSVATASPINLRVYNADPLPQGQWAIRSKENPCQPDPQGSEATPALHYNLLQRERIDPWNLARYLRYFNKTNVLLSDERDCCIDSSVRDGVIETAKRLVASFRVGAIVELATLVSLNGDWREKAMSLIESAVKCWLSKARVVEENGVMKAKFSTKLMDGFRLLIHAHAIFTGVEKLLRDMSREECTIDSREFSKECIASISRNIMRGSELTSALISHEIGVLENMRKDGKIPGDWTPYARVLGESRVGEAGGDMDVDACEEHGRDLDKLKRHFIAHAGFLRDILEVRSRGEDIRLRVRETCHGLLNKILDEIFSDLARQY